MAEIKIEKKKPVWPWILLILGLIALVYFLFFRDRETEQEVIQDVEETTSMKIETLDENAKALPPVYKGFANIHKQIA